jgi:hypothetical protein
MKSPLWRHCGLFCARSITAERREHDDADLLAAGGNDALCTGKGSRHQRTEDDVRGSLDGIEHRSFASSLIFSTSAIASAKGES